MGGGERTSNPCSTAQRFTSLFIPLDADGPLPFEQCGTGLTPRVGFKYCFAFASNVTGPRDQAETDFFSGHRKGYYWIKALASAASLIEIRRSQEGTETRESPAHTSNSVELNHSRPPNHTTGPSPSRQHVFLQSRDPQRWRYASLSIHPLHVFASPLTHCYPRPTCPPCRSSIRLPPSSRAPDVLALDPTHIGLVFRRRVRDVLARSDDRDCVCAWAKGGEDAGEHARRQGGHQRRGRGGSLGWVREEEEGQGRQVSTRVQSRRLRATEVDVHGQRRGRGRGKGGLVSSTPSSFELTSSSASSRAFGSALS